MKKICVAFILALTSIVLANPSFGDVPFKEGAIKVRSVLLPYMTFAPLFIAQEEGFFISEGLDVEWIKFNRTADSVVALMRGNLDVVPGAITASQFNAMAAGGRIAYVAGRGHFDPASCSYEKLLLRRPLARGFQNGDLTILKGKRINFKPVSYTAYILDTTLKTAGLAVKDVETVIIPPPSQLDAMRKGSIDATITGEPWLTELVLDGNSVPWLDLGKLMPGLQRAVILYGPTFLDENKEAGVRFMTAYLKGVRQYNEGKTKRNIEILTKYTKLDQDLLEKICWPPMRNDGSINVQSFLEFQDWLRENGILEETVPMEKFWAPQFIEEAAKLID